MEYKMNKIGEKNCIIYHTIDREIPESKHVLETWENSTFSYPKITANKELGFRSAQLGAIYAIKSYWTISSHSATVVMPTGTGKTEVMIATVISEPCQKTCVIVPSDLLRKQTAERFCTLTKLREIGAINDSFENPIVGMLLSIPKDLDELIELIDKSNVIITTMSLVSRKKFVQSYITMLSSMCDTLIIDEAHHVPAKTWSQIKSYFTNAKCLQFTATPYRNDGKKIDGDIIYNFPLSLAQQEGYFKPIKFYPLFEFDENRKDLSIAKKAVALLDEDIKNNLSHLLLVRAANQKRAQFLYKNIYKKHFDRHSPVLIISDNKKADNKTALKSVYNGDSKIIVCVDMFSEGIDIPQLKICAIHDKYKSLPITLQFIGRFARSQQNLGDASIVANIIDDDIQESLDELYSQDADWNLVIKTTSDSFIEHEIEFQQFARGFNGTEVIPIEQIRPKISMFMYTTESKCWHWENWKSVFDEEHSRYFVNKDEKILVVTELSSINVEWTSIKDITDENWNLHILYWNEKRNVFFINTTIKGMANKLAEAIFDNSKLIKGEDVFRCLSGIKRLMLSSVGLKTAISNHHIRYRMFAGVDVAEGITNAVKGKSIKSNLFGVGFENGEKISIGCSYKGTIWAKWVETIDYWCKWCNKQADKILNSSINTTDILENALVPEEITRRPDSIPYRIDFPMIIDEESKCSFSIDETHTIYDSMSIDIGLTKFDEVSPLSFYVGNEYVREEFIMDINDKGYNIFHKEGSVINIRLSRNQEIRLRDFLQDNPPTFWFVDGSFIEGNLIVALKKKPSVLFSHQHIITWDWKGIDIKKESQGKEKSNDSIQYNVIALLKKSKRYCVIFDDDGAGEIADVVAIKENSQAKTFEIELYHCKYSHGNDAGARIADLYEVCGQAEKCIRWMEDSGEMFARLLDRENNSKKNRDVSRFELGNEKILYQMKKKLKFYTTTFSVYIVQPGVDSNKISPPMHQVLCCSQAYLQDTYAVPLKLICS